MTGTNRGKANIGKARMYFIALCFCVPSFFMPDPSRAESSVPRPFIYVADFELEVEDVREGTRVLPHPLDRRGPIGKLRSSGSSQDNPEARAREIVDLMSNSLVRGLKDLGYGSRRLAPSEVLPVSGILVRGLFANVDEGNRLRRAVIGFGAGHTDLQVIVSVHTLGRDSVDPFYEVNTGAKKGKMPGAVITLNPYVAAAKFVLAGKDMKKSIAQTASKITSAIDKQIRSSITNLDGASATPLSEPEP